MTDRYRGRASSAPGRGSSTRRRSRTAAATRRGNRRPRATSVTECLPPGSTAMAVAASFWSLPRSVEYTIAVPAAFSFVAKASEPPERPPSAPGKFGAVVKPATPTCPAATTARCWGASSPLRADGVPGAVEARAREPTQARHPAPGDEALGRRGRVRPAPRHRPARGSGSGTQIGGASDVEVPVVADAPLLPSRSPAP